MKKLLGLLLALICSTAAAQTNQAFPQKVYYASDYGVWSVPGQTPNTYQFSPASQCEIPKPSVGKFEAFNVNAPIYLQDANAANSELLTPAFVLINESLCEVALTPVHPHYSFSLMSGTAGLQEALNDISANIPYAVPVILDRNWYTAIQAIPGQTATAIISTAKGSAAAVLEDITQAPTQFYRWNGTNYVAVSPAGASIPATGGLLSTTGVAGQASASNVLANGVTATTQASGDTTAQVATDAFVIANVGGVTAYTAGVNSIPAATLVMGDGTGKITPYVVTATNYGLYTGVATVAGISGASVTVANGSGQLAACQFDGTPVIGDIVIGSSTTPGDCHDAAATQVVSVQPRVPIVGWVQSVSGTVGTVRLAGLGVWGSGNVVVTNTLSNQSFFGPLTVWGSVSPTQLGRIFDVDGFVNGNNYPGIGVAQSVWSSGTNYGQCSAVAYNASSITAWSIANTAANSTTNAPAFSTATFTASNTYTTGQFVTLSGFGTSTFFNGMSIQVTSASSTQFAGVLPQMQTAGSSTESGAGTNNYLSVVYRTTNTPGQAANTWYPVPNGATPTALDCAWYSAAASILATGTGTVTNTNGASLMMSAGNYITDIGLLEPTVPSPTQPTISIFGQGSGQTVVTQGPGKNDGLAELEQPMALCGYCFANFVWQGFTVNGNFLPSALVNVYGASQFTIRNVTMLSPADKNDHALELGNYADTAHGWAFQPTLQDVNVGYNAGSGSGAVIPVTVSGGVPSFTITSGGSGYPAADVSATLVGYSNFGRPCSSIGTTTATLTGGVVTAINSTATGCVAPLNVLVYGGLNVSYGIKFSNVSDSEHIDSIASSIGTVAGLLVSNISSQNVISKYHPDNVPVALIAGGSNAYYDLQCDTIRMICAEVLNDQNTFYHPTFEWADPYMAGYVDWYFPSVSGTIGYNTPLYVNIYDEQCGNFPNFANYAHFVTSQGVVDAAVGSDGATLPTYVHDHHAIYCNQLLGASTPSLNVITPQEVTNTETWSNGVLGNYWTFGMGTDRGTANTQVMTVNQTNSITTANQGVYTWNDNNPTSATSGQNYNSPIKEQSGAYWNGTVSTNFGVQRQLTFATGSNPVATYATTHVGTLPTGGLVYSWDGQIKSTVTTGTAPFVVSSTTQVANLNAATAGTATSATTAAALSAASALPSGTTATTQAVGDNTTNVATDAFVISNAYAGFNVKNYGAACALGTDDTTAYQNALTAASASYSSTGQITTVQACPAGQLGTSTGQTTINIGSGVKLVGPSLITVPAQSANPLFLMTSTDQDTIDGLNITYASNLSGCATTVNNAACVAIRYDSANPGSSTAHQGILIQNNKIYNSDWGMLISPSSGTDTLKDVKITHNYIGQAGAGTPSAYQYADGIHVGGSISTIVIDNNSVTGRGDAGIALTSELLSGSTLVCSGATITGNNLFQDAVGIDDSGCNNVTVTGNQVLATISTSNSNPAFRSIVYGGNLPTSITVTGNYFQNYQSSAGVPDYAAKFDCSGKCGNGAGTVNSMYSTFTGNTLPSLYLKGSALTVSGNNFSYAGALTVDVDSANSNNSSNVVIGQNNWDGPGTITANSNVNFYPNSLFSAQTGGGSVAFANKASFGDPQVVSAYEFTVAQGGSVGFSSTNPSSPSTGDSWINRSGPGHLVVATSQGSTSNTGTQLDAYTVNANTFNGGTSGVMNGEYVNLASGGNLNFNNDTYFNRQAVGGFGIGTNSTNALGSLTLATLYGTTDSVSYTSLPNSTYLCSGGTNILNVSTSTACNALGVLDVQYINATGNIKTATGQVFSWSTDTALSRDSAGVVDVGTGLQGSKAGSLNVLNVTATGYVSTAYTLPNTIYSAAATALPTCNSALRGADAKVGDATSPTFMGAYTSGGAITAAVLCSFNGSTYSWLTH